MCYFIKWHGPRQCVCRAGVCTPSNISNDKLQVDMAIMSGGNPMHVMELFLGATTNNRGDAYEPIGYVFLDVIIDFHHLCECDRHVRRLRKQHRHRRVAMILVTESCTQPQHVWSSRNQAE